MDVLSSPMSSSSDRPLSLFALLGLASAGTATAAIGFLYSRVQNLQKELDHVKQLRADERSGRIRAERRLAAESTSSTTSSASVDNNDTTATSAAAVQQQHQVLQFKPIAHVKSMFRTRHGCPRQGSLVPSAHSLVVFEPFTAPRDSTEGLEAFSHVWVIWVFDRNTNEHKMSMAAQDSARSAIKAKVRPPRLDGVKTGLYSTRTPHRHCNIGLSCAQLVARDPKTGSLTLSGLDLVDGTAVLDVKPYIPEYDSFPVASVAGWVEGIQERLEGVSFAPEVLETLAAITADEGEDPLVHSADQLQRTIAEIITLDPRSVHQRRTASSETEFLIQLHKWTVSFTVDSKSQAHVVKISLT